MKLAFREYGTGQPLVILHGLFGQSDNWNTLAKQFAENGLRVFAIDQRNHGLSPHDAEWTYEAMAADLKEFISEHKLVAPVLLGHSMGAKTVMFYEKMNPGAAEKIILVDMGARTYRDNHRDVIKALNAVDFDAVKNRKEAEAVLNEHISDFGTKQFLLKNLFWKEQENGGLDWRFNLKVITSDYDNVGVQVPPFVSHVPTLVIKGAKSDYVREEDLEDFRKRFINLRTVTIDQAGHWVHAEKPKELFEVVMNFIIAEVV